MSEFSRAQEREERRRINSGMKVSISALLLSWLPFLGVLLGSIGFVKVAGSVTRRYRGKRRLGLLLAVLALVVALAATAFEVYTYVHNPWVLSDMRNWFMDRLTGGSWDAAGYDYSAQPLPGMGQNGGAYVQGYTPEGYYNEKGELIPYAEPEQAEVGEDERGG